MPMFYATSEGSTLYPIRVSLPSDSLSKQQTTPILVGKYPPVSWVFIIYACTDMKLTRAIHNEITQKTRRFCVVFTKKDEVSAIHSHSSAVYHDN